MLDKQVAVSTLIVLIGIVLLLWWRIRVLSRKLDDVQFRKKSGEVLHGKTWENFAPFMQDYPYDPNNFRFLGNPIDGVSFEEDKIVFIEFKTGNSALSSKQRMIRDLVERGRVEWEEIRG